MQEINDERIFANMILILRKEDFNPEFLPLVGAIFQHGFNGKNHSIVDSKEFANIVVHHLNLQMKPGFKMPFGIDCEYNKIVEFTEKYPQLMFVND